MISELAGGSELKKKPKKNIKKNQIANRLWFF